MSESASPPACPNLTVAPSATHFLLDGTPTFLLADTLWAAFSRMSEHEWCDALRLRRRQGFNAVNVSILPIAHDRSLSGDARAPFEVRPDGRWRLDTLDAAYFPRARAMVQLAQEHGMVPILVVLWCNYVPGTWGAERTPALVMSEGETSHYVDSVLDTFADLDPVFCISGDDSLDSDESLGRYAAALAQVAAAAPQCLTTYHSTPSARMPMDLARDPGLGYYSYQAGHDDGWEQRAAELPAHYLALPQRPLVSMEPCYEGHGFGAGRARHDARDVRLASWAGVLAGAGAGLGYAAHGAWSWHRAGEPFNGEHFSGTPLPAARALELRGAWDVGLLRRIVEEHGLYDLRLHPERIRDNRSGALFGVSRDGSRAAAYLPWAFPMTVTDDWTDCRLEVWDLERARRDHVTARRTAEGTVFDQPDFVGDALYVLTR